jgi:hypothetical protein
MRLQLVLSRTNYIPSDDALSILTTGKWIRQGAPEGNNADLYARPITIIKLIRSFGRWIEDNTPARNGGVKAMEVFKMGLPAPVMQSDLKMYHQPLRCLW